MIIWEANTSEPHEFTPLNAEDKKLLDERLADLRNDPEAGEPWEQILTELRALLWKGYRD
jgi:putative addiction module component (TIGR02574 family)